MSEIYMHRVWLGSEMPDKYKEYGRLWSELNPDYTLVDWDEAMVFDRVWRNQRVLDDLKEKSQKPGADMVAYYTHVADVIDYELIYEFGGWYFNTDIKPIKPLSTLNVDWMTPALAMEDDVHPVNMAMHGPKFHPFFKFVIETLPGRYFSMPGAFMNASTGVQLLQACLQHYSNPAIKYFHRNVFNPIHWSEFDYGTEPETNREYPEETVAVHEWLHRTNQRGQRVLET